MTDNRNTHEDQDSLDREQALANVDESIAIREEIVVMT